MDRMARLLGRRLGICVLAGIVLAGGAPAADFDDLLERLGRERPQTRVIDKAGVFSEQERQELKANQNFIALQDELAGTENRISVERQRYNEAVRAFNIAVAQFPASAVAAFRGFSKRDAYFQSAADAKTAPKVEF